MSARLKLLHLAYGQPIYGTMTLSKTKKVVPYHFPETTRTVPTNDMVTGMYTLSLLAPYLPPLLLVIYRKHLSLGPTILITIPIPTMIPMSVERSVHCNFCSRGLTTLITITILQTEFISIGRITVESDFWAQSYPIKSLGQSGFAYA